MLKTKGAKLIDHRAKISLQTNSKIEKKQVNNYCEVLKKDQKIDQIGAKNKQKLFAIC